MKNNIKLALVLGGLSVGLFASNANASFVSDGDFASPSGGGSFTTYSSGSSFGPWNVATGSVDLIGSYWQSPTVGGGSVDLDGTSPGSINQALSLGAGSYKLTFSLSGNPDNGAETNALQVSVGNALQTFNYTTGSNTHANMQYLTESVAFTTTGPTNLVFASLDRAGAFGPVIGGVSVSSVPLPASLPMFVTGLLGLFGVRGFSKRKLNSAI